MKKYIYANLKTNLFETEIEEYLKTLNDKQYPNEQMVYLNALYILPMIRKFNPKYLGIQSFDVNEMGAYTSSVSYQQLMHEGIQNVLIGHSEEMKYFGLEPSDVNCQLKCAIQNGLKVTVHTWWVSPHL